MAEGAGDGAGGGGGGGGTHSAAARPRGAGGAVWVRFFVEFRKELSSLIHESLLETQILRVMTKEWTSCFWNQ